MDNYGLSSLEIRALIERVFLPDTCRSEISQEGLLRLTVTSSKMPSCCVTMPDTSLGQLNTVRAIAELVGETRYLLALQMGAQPDVRVPKQSVAGYSHARRS